jgi:hypothetical protein
VRKRRRARITAPSLPPCCSVPIAPDRAATMVRKDCRRADHRASSANFFGNITPIAARAPLRLPPICEGFRAPITRGRRGPEQKVRHAIPRRANLPSASHRRGKSPRKIVTQYSHCFRRCHRCRFSRRLRRRLKPRVVMSPRHSRDQGPDGARRRLLDRAQPPFGATRRPSQQAREMVGSRHARARANPRISCPKSKIPIHRLRMKFTGRRARTSRSARMKRSRPSRQ